MPAFTIITKSNCFMLTYDWQHRDLSIDPRSPPQLDGDCVVWIKRAGVIVNPGDDSLRPDDLPQLFIVVHGVDASSLQ